MKYFDSSKYVDGTSLKDDRVRRKISRAVISRFMGVDYITVYKWETGRNSCPKYVSICYSYYFEKFNKQPTEVES